jgi:hypothetical protein
MEQMKKHVRKANTVPCTHDILYRTSAECPINIDSLCQQLTPIHCSDRSLCFLKAFILNQRISLSQQNPGEDRGVNKREYEKPDWKLLLPEIISYV